MAEHLLGLPIKHKLKDIQDVILATVGNGQVLAYESASEKWKNKDIDFISGVITDAQHGTKTTIPNAHHNKEHTHAHRHHLRMGQTTITGGEKSTSSTTYVDLCGGNVWENVLLNFPFGPPYVHISFSCNFKVGGTLESRGGYIAFFKTKDDWATKTQVGPDVEYADNVTFYKVLTRSHAYVESSWYPNINVGYGVFWKCMNSSYPLTAKNFSLQVFASVVP